MLFGVGRVPLAWLAAKSLGRIVILELVVKVFLNGVVPILTRFNTGRNLDGYWDVSVNSGVLELWSGLLVLFVVGDFDVWSFGVVKGGEELEEAKFKFGVLSVAWCC